MPQSTPLKYHFPICCDDHHNPNIDHTMAHDSKLLTSQCSCRQNVIICRLNCATSRFGTPTSSTSMNGTNKDEQTFRKSLLVAPSCTNHCHPYRQNCIYSPVNMQRNNFRPPHRLRFSRSDFSMNWKTIGKLFTAEFSETAKLNPFSHFLR